MEKVDIVNEHNQVIATETRERAHLMGLLHGCVIAELKIENDWIFVKQSAHMQDSGQLASATGGHIKSGETEYAALKREVNEELGINKFKYKLRGRVIYKRTIKNRIENHFFSVYDIESKGRIKLNEESDEVQRFTDNELKKELKKNPQYFGGALMFIFKNLYPELLK